MRRILVTGGAGFIGSNFVRHMLDRHADDQIVVLDALTYAGTMDNFAGLSWQEFSLSPDTRLSFWHGNVRDSDMVDHLVSNSDVVIHFAAESHVTRSIYSNHIFFETDVLGTQCIANAVAKHQSRIERFIHISSSEVYGTALTPHMDETHPLNPMSPYASAKAGADRLVYSYWATYGIPAVIVRPFNNYGPRQHLEKMVPRFITSCLLDEPVTVHGDGKAERDWLFVEDHCAAIERLLDVPVRQVAGEVINLGTGISLDILTIARMVCQATGKPESLITHVHNRPGQVDRHTASIDKAERLLGWKAATPFAEGLARTVDWYADNRWWWERQLSLRRIPVMTKTGKVELH